MPCPGRPPLTSSLAALPSGSDGLLKLWTIKNSECEKTLDGHQGKVWGLHANKQQSLVVTGASDSSVVLWKVQAKRDTELMAVLQGWLIFFLLMSLFFFFLWFSTIYKSNT